MELKKLRVSKGLTQEQVSFISGVPLRTYKRIENDSKYQNSSKYKDVFSSLELYQKKQNSGLPTCNIVVVGAGYVGFSLAVLLSNHHHVTVVDIKEEKVNKINNRIPVFKDKLIEQFLKTRKLDLHASLPNREIYENADYVILALPTDYDEQTKKYNASSLVNTIREIREVNKDVLIIIKSTCNIGFTESLNDKKVVFSPEFLREGNSLYDNLYPSRIIIGGSKTKEVVNFVNLLKEETINNPSVLYMSSKEAEATKLFSNAYLAMRVAFFNELDSVSLSYNLSTSNVIEGVSLDPRIGDYYNNPSFGYGGYCLPKDTSALISQSENVSNNDLLSSIDRSNKSRKQLIVDDIVSRLKPDSVIGVYSLESKKDSDNTRHAAIIDVINGLNKLGFTVIYNNPNDQSFEEFKKKSDLIITNRYDSSLDDVKHKVYTRDIFIRD